MFKSISDKLDRFQKSVEVKKDRQLVAQEVINCFIKDLLGEVKVSVCPKVSYDHLQQQILIETKSKTLSSEILLRASEINTLLRQKNIYLKHLIVR